VAKYREELDRRRDEARTLGTGGPAPRPREVLAWAPLPTAWANGVHGARYAALLAAPWIAIGMAGLLGSGSGWLYPHWIFAYNVALTVGKWLAFGFVLGYFFPYLPGRTGLAKGLAVAAAATAPFLVTAGATWSSASDWRVPVVWTAQVLVHCAALGLVAFDYATLRRGSDRDWRVLFDVYGLPAMSLFVSSVAVAVGTAVTTLVSSQVAGLLGAALKYAIPPLVAGQPPAP
jgi:hypothetical protein